MAAHEDPDKWGPSNLGTRGPRDVGTPWNKGHGCPQGPRSTRTSGPKLGTWRPGDSVTRGHSDQGTWGHRDTVTKGHEDTRTQLPIRTLGTQGNTNPRRRATGGDTAT